jgi:hypothetical protein
VALPRLLQLRQRPFDKRKNIRKRCSIFFFLLSVTFDDDRIRLHRYFLLQLFPLFSDVCEHLNLFLGRVFHFFVVQNNNKNNPQNNLTTCLRRASLRMSNQINVFPRFFCIRRRNTKSFVQKCRSNFLRDDQLTHVRHRPAYSCRCCTAHFLPPSPRWDPAVAPTLASSRLRLCLSARRGNCDDGAAAARLLARGASAAMPQAVTVDLLMDNKSFGGVVDAWRVIFAVDCTATYGVACRVAPCSLNHVTSLFP